MSRFFSSARPFHGDGAAGADKAIFEWWEKSKGCFPPCFSAFPQHSFVQGLFSLWWGLAESSAGRQVGSWLSGLCRS